MTAMLRIPPHSSEAEGAVLSALLQDNELLSDLSLPPEAFYVLFHRQVYEAIQALARARQPFDTLTVFEHMRGDSGAVYEEGALLAEISELTAYMPSAGNARRYAEIVLELHTSRKLVTAGDEIAGMGFADGPVADRVDRAQGLLSGLAPEAKDADWTSAYDGMVSHSAVLDQRHNGELEAWSTGLPDLDEYLEGGLRPGELVIVGARPSMGKTALGLTIAVHMALERSVAVLSMEMSKLELNDRLTAMLGRVSMSSVKRPRRGAGLDWGQVLEGVERAKSLRLHVSDQGGLTINQVRAKARNAKRLFGLEVLVVDYIGLMTGLDAKANRNAQLGEISRGLKNLAKELRISVLCLAQLNRKAEERSEQMPQMSDLRDSGEIEQDADVILFIKRPIMNDQELGLEWQHYAKLSIAKNRQGRCGLIDLAYIGEQTRFSGWAGPAPQKQTATRVRGGNL
jgi:replicative DNA helicase